MAPGTGLRSGGGESGSGVWRSQLGSDPLGHIMSSLRQFLKQIGKNRRETGIRGTDTREDLCLSHGTSDCWGLNREIDAPHNQASAETSPPPYRAECLSRACCLGSPNQMPHYPLSSPLLISARAPRGRPFFPEPPNTGGREGRRAQHHFSSWMCKGRQQALPISLPTK